MQQAFPSRPNVIAALLAAGGAAFAPNASAQAAGIATAAPMPVVIVTGSRIEQDSFDFPAAVDTVDAQRIGSAWMRVNASEALAAVPGLVVLNRQNYAQDLQISSRGFGARSAFGVRGVRLIADGIPASMPDGQGQAATFNVVVGVANPGGLDFHQHFAGARTFEVDFGDGQGFPGFPSNGCSRFHVLFRIDKVCRRCARRCQASVRRQGRS